MTLIVESTPNPNLLNKLEFMDTMIPFRFFCFSVNEFSEKSRWHCQSFQISILDPKKTRAEKTVCFFVGVSWWLVSEMSYWYMDLCRVDFFKAGNKGLRMRTVRMMMNMNC